MRLYDSFNRTVQKSVKGMGTSSFDYGDQGEKKPTGEGYTHKETTVDIKGNTLTQTFDENGRLKAVEDGQDKTEYVYNDNGSKAQTLYPGGISTNYSYNPDNTVKSLSNQSASGVIDNYSYEYDDCGNMLRKTDSSGTTVYTYDPLNRIKTIVEPSKKTTEYEYDAAGNRIRERVTGGSEIITKDYTYNSQNRLMEIVKHDLTGNVEEKQKFVYDNNGNQLYFKIELTERATEDAKQSFGMFISGESYSGESAKKFFESNSVNTYNAFNQLIKTTVGDVEVRHKYDPEGKRIEKAVVKAGKSKTIKYLRLGNEIAMEVDEKGDVISRNVNGTAPISRETDGNKYFLLYNGEGDVTALVDRTGRVAERYEYDAFGNVTKAVDGNGKSLGMGESKNPVRYRGYEYDEETKLYYLNARMYDPSIARFIQEDTYRGNLKDPLSLNLYMYCHNNPIYYNDPTGHAANTINRIERDDSKGTTHNKPTKPATTTKTPAPKPTLDDKIRSGNATISDIGKMNNSQLMDVIVRAGSDYASASAKEKQQLHALAEASRKELLKDNKGNELIAEFVKNGNVKGAVAVTDRGNVKLDALTISNLVKNGTSDDYDVKKTLTPSTKPAEPKKPAPKVEEKTTKDEKKSVAAWIATPIVKGLNALDPLIQKQNDTHPVLNSTKPLGNVEISATTLFTNILATATGSALANTAQIEKQATHRITGRYNEIQPLPANNELKGLPYKELERGAKVLTGVTASFDIANTWTADNDNTVAKRLEKTAIQVGGIYAGIKISEKTAKAAIAGMEAQPELIPIILLSTAAVDVGIALSISEVQNEIYEERGIK